MLPVTEGNSKGPTLATSSRARKTTKRTAKKASKRVAKKATGARRTPTMSTAHKSALAEGRTQASAVRLYLDALEANKPKRGRKVTPESLRSKIEALNEKIPTVKRSARLELVQERLDLERKLETWEAPINIAALEKTFTRVAKAYASRKGISYTAFREVGVSAQVLKAAGIARTAA